MSMAQWQSLLFNRQIFFLLILPLINAQCDKATVAYSDLSIAFQHVQGKEATNSVAHTLATTQSVDGTTCSSINSGMVLDAATAACTSACLTALTPYKYTNGSDFVDIVMLKDSDVAAYPGYSAQAGIIYCASTKSYCGATVPLYNFVSKTYGDHYTSSNTTMPDSTYGYDNSGFATCYGWTMPMAASDQQELANYYSATNPMACDVSIYFGLVATSTAPSSTTSGLSSTPIASTTASSTVLTTASVTVASTSKSAATSSAASTAAVTTQKISTASIGITTPNTGVTQATTKAITDASGNTIPITTPIPATNPPVTDSSGIPVTDSSGNTITYPPPTLPPSKDDIGDGGNKKKGLAVWVWVVLGVGLGVLALAAIGMAYFVYTNFVSKKPVRGRINPYDRDLYDRDLYSTPNGDIVPPIPVQTMPAQTTATMNAVGGNAAAAHYSGIGVAESSII